MAGLYDSTKNPFSEDYNPQGDGRGTGVSFGDDALAFGAGVGHELSNWGSGARAAADASGSPNAAKIADFFRVLFKDAAVTADEHMSQDARDRLNSAILGKEFWEHPISAGTLKALNMSPTIAPAVAGAIFGGAAGATGVGALQGAAASAADVFDQTDEMSDEELQNAMPYYAGLRDMGVPEDEARADANQKLMGLKPLLNAAGTGLAMALGPAGRVAGLVPEGAGASFLKRMLAGAGEGALGGAVMTGTMEATHQQTEVELDKRTQLDPATILAASAEGAALQGLLGAAGGVFTGGERAPSRVKRDFEDVPARGADAAQELALRGEPVEMEPMKAETPPTPIKEVTTPEKPVTPPVVEENLPLGRPETPVSAPPDIPATPENAPVEPPTLKTTPGAIAAEHAAEVSTLEAQGTKAAAEKLLPPKAAEAVRVSQSKQPVVKGVPSPPKTTVVEAPVYELPTELPAKVTADIEKRLGSMKAAAERLVTAGQGPKEGVEAFIAKKREQLESAAWHEIAKDAVTKATTKSVVPKSREGKGPENRVGKHLSKSELNKRAEDELAAGNIAQEHPPSVAEEGDFRRDPEIQAAIMKRAESMVALASERKVRIFQRIRDSKNKTAEVKNWSTLLTMARELVRSGGKSFKAYDDFLTADRLLRTGAKEDKDLVLSLRRAEGDASMRTPPAEGKGIEEMADSAASPEDLVDVKRELEIAPIERPKIADASERVVEGKDQSERVKSGLIRVETKKKPRMASMKKVESRQELGAHKQHEAEYANAEKFEKAIRGKSIHEVAKYITDNAPTEAARMIGERIQKTLSKLAASGMKFEFNIARTGEQAPNGLQYARGLTLLHNEAAPRTAIWLSGADRGLGLYGTNYETVAHELIHGVTQAALHLGRVHGPMAAEIGQLRKEMVNIGNAVVRQLNKKFDEYRNGNLDILTPFEKDIYENRTNALLDEHEILAYGLTNKGMQDLLESTPYKVNSEKGVVRSLFDKFASSIRRFLGLPERADTAFSEVLRVADRLFEQDTDLVVQNVGSIWKRPISAHAVAQRMPGRFDENGTVYNEEIDNLFRPKLGDALRRSAENGKIAAKDFVATAIDPPKAIASILETAHGGGRAFDKIRDYVTTTDQYVSRPEVKRLIPNGRDIADIVQKTGIYASKLKDEGLDLSAALLRAQQTNPKLFAQFAKLLHEQTMYGADASQELGVGRNSHLSLSKELSDKIAAGKKLSDLEHEVAMASWEGRRAHPQMKAMYDALVAQEPQLKTLQERVFKFYEDSQRQLTLGQIEHILQSYDFKGTDAERAVMADRIYNDRLTGEFQKELEDNIGESAVEALKDTKALKVVNGPYAPLMRRGDHVVVGEYKLAPGGKQVEPNVFEFDTRKEAHKFAASTGLHTDPTVVYYDPVTGKKTTKSEGLSLFGTPTEKYQVRVNNRHVEFFESEREARARLKELEESGQFSKLGLEERRNIIGEENQFSDRGVERLIKSLEKSDRYKNSPPAQQEQLRASIREAGLSAMAGNRVQSRRLPRRFVQGASDDIARNLFDYNASQSNYRAQLKFRPELDEAMKEMWDNVKAHTYDPSNAERSRFANEIEKRVRAQDPNEYTGKYAEATRRVATWSYINVMGRASHLILHQTHLPMITAPYMAGRHGLLRTYGTIMKTWKEMSGVYGVGVSDTAKAIADHLTKGTDYSGVIKDMVKKAPDAKRVSDMIDKLTELGIIHPQSNIEVGRFMPSKQLPGLAGAFDHGMMRVDTIFRQMTNATEAINRFVGATAAYRMEFSKLTRAGNSEAVAHQKAIEYARTAVSDTQGLYSSTNAAPLFKNKFLRPFLQFKQFPQMMYHLLGKLTMTALKGETREVKVQAMASLAGILGMHAMMAGAVQGLPLEVFKLLGFVSKAIGLTNGDWTDVEQAVTREMQAKLGKHTADIFLHGLGAEAGVDVHHRLGLNSFVTYGMPDEVNATNMKEFLFNAVVGAPGTMVENSFKGVHKMLEGDLENGALDAFPMQMLRDIRNATVGKEYADGEKPTAGERGLMAIGFTPARKAAARTKREAVYNAVHEYNTQRYNLINSWVKAEPVDRDAIWEKISSWNEGKDRNEKITKGDLFKSMARGAHPRPGSKVDKISVDRHTRKLARDVSGLY